LSAGRTTVGVLALQGAFAAHAQLLEALGAEAREVRSAADLEGCEALVLPGGESSVHLRLLAEARLDVAIERFAGPLLGTCAGLILLAKRVTNPEQRSLGLLDVDVRRNAYGRQRDSFEDERGRIFIRAPRIERVGPGVEVLAARGAEPLAVRAGRVLGATYHPELAGDSTLHRALLELARARRPAARAAVAL
jgi:5'-phosphate synthase pdxT subunit